MTACVGALGCSGSSCKNCSPKEGIAKEDLSPFLGTWLDRTSADCMFSKNQLRTWSSAHLRGMGWYLECGAQHVPNIEDELFRSFSNAADATKAEEQFAHLDPKARDRAIKADQKKADKVKDVVEKKQKDAVEKKDKQDRRTKDKGQGKSREKGHNRKGKEVGETPGERLLV